MTVDAHLCHAVERLIEAGVEQPRLEAQLLLAHALSVPRTAIITGSYPEPAPSTWERFADLVRNRARRVPLAYLRGTREFYGLSFLVGPGVLVPRPETEMLVEAVIDTYRSGAYCVRKPFLFADVGAGSGCIAIAVLVHCPHARAVGWDIAQDALILARENAARIRVGHRIRFACSDMLSAERERSLDLIVSNPPYIPTADIAALQPEVSRFEPRQALDGGHDGLNALRALARTAPQALKSGGALFAEVGLGQSLATVELFRAAGLVDIRSRRDLAGIERVVGAYKSS